MDRLRCQVIDWIGMTCILWVPYFSVCLPFGSVVDAQRNMVNKIVVSMLSVTQINPYPCPSHWRTALPAIDVDSAMQDVDSDWAEDIALEEDDSGGEDSVSRSPMCNISKVLSIEYYHWRYTYVSIKQVKVKTRWLLFVELCFPLLSKVLNYLRAFLFVTFQLNYVSIFIW